MLPESENLTKIAFIVNGGSESAMGYRARAFAGCLQSRFKIEVAYREKNKLASIIRFLFFLRQEKPQVSYIFDMGYSGVVAAWLHRLLYRNRMVIDTGDVIYELMRSTGNRSWVGLQLTGVLEKFSLRVADRIVVRGRYHREWLAHRSLSADVIPDGVDTEEFKPLNVSGLKEQLGLDGFVTVGLVGSSIWSERLQMCYGWEVVELLRLLPHVKVKGVIVGSGSGIAHLKNRCRQYELEDRVLFVPHVPYHELPRYLNVIDICLSTQTNDVVGQVRTSGKLPLYLAAGHYVLASDVGEAALVCERDMLVPYDGVHDLDYPNKLAERVEALLDQPVKLENGLRNIAVAKNHFEYSKLADRLAETVNRVLNNNAGQLHEDLDNRGPDAIRAVDR
jgi:glycosyltransferase involved in cell wall biosynthesis